METSDDHCDGSGDREYSITLDANRSSEGQVGSRRAVAGWEGGGGSDREGWPQQDMELDMS